ncbi:hypothetical protein CspeluHIS016_0200800 [Cutaneotrichosporon spelunceum]|uniref:Uncharacterized protein n=1 Tax=Cutaneotrichosporon spelunceum TaxID=1672016 RepID=A0AAD3TQX9_9TREE|nr:hypothetical protein CspeluHIS016_0200800 [Cutaneotrichosporon spelunceum]
MASLPLVKTSSDSDHDASQSVGFAHHNATNDWFRVSVEHLPQASVEASAESRVARMARGDGTTGADGGGGKMNLPDEDHKSNGEQGPATDNTANNTANSELSLHLRRGLSLQLRMPTPIPPPSQANSPMATPTPRLASPDGVAKTRPISVPEHLMEGVPMKRTRASYGKLRVDLRQLTATRTREWNEDVGLGYVRSHMNRFDNYRVTSKE